MKAIIILSTILLTSCGVAEKLRENCGNDIEEGCNAIFGYKNKDQDDKLKQLEEKNKEQDNAISRLETQAETQIDMIDSLVVSKNDLYEKIQQINVDISTLRNDVSIDSSNKAQQILQLQNQLAGFTSSYSMLTTQVNTLNSQVATLMVQMLSVNNTLPVLQSSVSNLTATVSHSVIGMYDPCGVNGGFNEVLLKTADGQWIGYFETGGYRFLSVLTRGQSYRTTDTQQCYFSISNSGNITNEHL